MDSDSASSPAKVSPEAARVTAQWKHGSPLISCRFDPTGKFVFATAQDRSILRWELASEKLTTFQAHDSWVRSLTFTPDGHTLVTGGYDQQMIWWPATAEQPEPIRKVTAHEGWVRWIATNLNGTMLASGGNDQRVKLWNASDGQLLHEFLGHDRHVYSTLFHADGKYLFSGDLRGVVKKWDLETRTEVNSFDAKQLYAENPGQGAEYGGVRSMALDGTGQQLICSGLHKASNPFGAEQEPLVVVLDVDSGETLRTHTSKDDLKCICWRAVWHRSGFLVGGVGGKAGGFILFWNADTEKESFRFALPNTAMDMDLHPSGLQIATAHYDGHLRLTSLVVA